MATLYVYICNKNKKKKFEFLNLLFAQTFKIKFDDKTTFENLIKKVLEALNKGSESKTANSKFEMKDLEMKLGLSKSKLIPIKYEKNESIQLVPTNIPEKSSSNKVKQMASFYEKDIVNKKVAQLTVIEFCKNSNILLKPNKNLYMELDFDNSKYKELNDKARKVSRKIWVKTQAAEAQEFKKKNSLRKVDIKQKKK